MHITEKLTLCHIVFVAERLGKYMRGVARDIFIDVKLMLVRKYFNHITTHEIPIFIAEWGGQFCQVVNQSNMCHTLLICLPVKML